MALRIPGVLLVLGAFGGWGWGLGFRVWVSGSAAL